MLCFLHQTSRGADLLFFSSDVLQTRAELQLHNLELNLLNVPERSSDSLVNTAAPLCGSSRSEEEKLRPSGSMRTLDEFMSLLPVAAGATGLTLDLPGPDVYLLNSRKTN